MTRCKVHDVPLRHSWVRNLAMKLRPWVAPSHHHFIDNPAFCHHLVNSDTSRSSGSCLSTNSQSTFTREPRVCVSLLIQTLWFRHNTHGHLLVSFQLLLLIQRFPGGINGWVINECKGFVTILLQSPNTNFYQLCESEKFVWHL